MPTSLTRRQLEKQLSSILERFRNQDLIELSDCWRKVYDTIPEYLSEEKPVDQNLLWMLEGTDDALPDLIYHLQRIKSCLVDALIADKEFSELKAVIRWFDGVEVVLVEKASGKMSVERSLLEPYEAIFWKARDGMYISSIEGKFIHCNQAMIEMLGYDSLEELLQINISQDLYLDEEQRKVMLDHLFQDGFYDHHEFNFHDKDGTEKTALESCFLVDAPEGKRFIVGLMIDVTKDRETQRKTEQYIRAIEKQGIENHLAAKREVKRGEALMTVSDHPVIIIDIAEFTIVDSNQAAHKRFKYGKKAMERVSFRKLFDAEDWMRIFEAATTSQSRRYFHIRNVTCLARGEQAFPADLAMLYYNNDLGAYLVVEVLDRTLLVQRDKRLDQMRDNLQNLRDNARVGMIGFDGEGEVRFVNPYLRELMGYSDRHLLKRDFVNSLFVREDQRLRFYKYIRQFIRGDHVHDIDVDLQTEGGDILNFKLTTTAFHFDGKIKSGFIALLNHVTAEKKLARLEERLETQPDSGGKLYQDLERQLQQLKKDFWDLERDTRFNREFFERFTQRCRVPIHLILGYGSLIRTQLKDALNQSQSEDLDILENQVQHLSVMVEMAYEFVLIESKDKSLEEEELSVRELVDDLFSRLKSEKTEKGVKLQLDNEVLHLDWFINSNQAGLFRCLQLITDNALKYTEKGKVHVRGFEEKGQLILEVQDSGCGIDSADQGRVFEPFFQAKPGTRNNEGLGLGLALAQAYAQRLNVKISLSSKSGKGTRVRLNLGEIDKRDPIQS